jgi:hypothetical protein
MQGGESRKRAGGAFVGTTTSGLLWKRGFCLLATHGRGNDDVSSDGAEDGRCGYPD